jgi:chemotaxis protein CheX
MKAEFINPFIDSALNVLSTMAQTTAEPKKPELKSDYLTRGAVTGLIGMAGQEISGNMLLSFDEPSIVAIVNRMLMEEYTSLDDQVVDAVGELTNMISGGTKAIFSEKGYGFEMATPVMLVGAEVEVKQLSNTPVISIPFSTPEGMFWIEANLAPVNQ